MSVAARLTATLRCDLRVQFRNGFYIAAALVAIVSILVLQWLPAQAVALLLPVVILENVMTNSFYFVSGLVMLERGEGTFAAQMVSPLRSREYLISKATALTALSIVESLVIALAAPGGVASVVPLAVGIFIASVLFTLSGVALACRHGSVNEFLMPSVVYTALLSLPVFGYFGIGPRWLYVAHPVQWCLDLMAAGFAPTTIPHLLFGTVYASIFVWPAFIWAEHSLRRTLA